MEHLKLMLATVQHLPISVSDIAFSVVTSLALATAITAVLLKAIDREEKKASSCPEDIPSN